MVEKLTTSRFGPNARTGFGSTGFSLRDAMSSAANVRFAFRRSHFAGNNQRHRLKPVLLSGRDAGGDAHPNPTLKFLRKQIDL